MWLRVLLVLAIGVAAQPGPAAAQTLTGSLVGIVKDTQGRVIEGAAVRVTSQSLGLVQSQKANRHGYLRFVALPPGEYVLDIEAPGALRRTAKKASASASAPPSSARWCSTSPAFASRSSCKVPARESRREAAGSRRASASRSSGRCRRDGSACSTSSEWRPVYPQPRPGASRATAFRYSAPAPTRTRF